MVKRCISELSEASRLCQEQINSKPSLKKSAFSSLPIQETGYNSGDFSSPNAIFCSWKSSPGNVLHAEVSGSHTWATVVFLRHPSLRSRASKWWWLRVWSSFLFMAPSLKICKCFKMSLVVLLGEFLVGEWWSGVHVFTLDEFCQILSLNFTQRHPWRCFCRQLPHHPRPTAACAINNKAEQWSLLRPERLHYMSLLLDVMTISQHPWQNSANQGYRCFNIFRDFTRGGGTTSINAGKYNTGIMLQKASNYKC